MRPLCVVVPHTHWDREWYQPFEIFRIGLVRAIDRLMDLLEADPAYAHFMLDGQSIVLEDYRAIRPEQVARLAAHVASGRIAIGPWYVLPDVFLVSGESLVRNLELGLAIAEAHGGSMRLGYLPDSFGHVAQMPQLLAGFGMDAASLWRGVPEENPGTAWTWEALDGSQVHVQWLSGGYGNLANLPAEPAAAVARFSQERARLEPDARGGVLLMMNGSDHLAPQPHLPALLDAFRAAHPDLEIRHASLTEAIAEARRRAGQPLAVVRGELRSSAHAHLLPGVLSARTYLKLANARCQTLLERRAEPLAALAALAGRAHPTALLAHAWKTLLANHPHDSICGCSVDAVHREMMTRFEAVAQVGERLVHESLAALAGEDPEADLPRQAGLALENPHPWPHRAVVEARLVLDTPPGAPAELTLTDEEGRVVPYSVLAEERGVRVVNRSPGYPLNVPVTALTLALAVDLPALGRRTLAVTRAGGPAIAADPGVEVGPDRIATPELAVRAVPGGLEVTDRATGRVVHHFFEDVADRGDEYNFCPLEGDAPWLSAGQPWGTVTTRVCARGAELVAEATWRLPAALAADRRARAGAADLPVRLTARLTPGVPRVDVEIALEHGLSDHRLRAAFRLPGPIASTRADTPYGIVERPARATPRPFPEPPVSTHPMLSHVSAGGFGVAAAGLHEYEAGGDTLYLTLIRAVGWLSRDDLSTRQGDAGPMLPTPEAQCPGPFRATYSLLAEDSPRRAAEAAVPALAFPVHAWRGHERRPRLELDHPAWLLDSVRQAHGGIEVRFHSTAATPTRGPVRWHGRLSGVARARLDGTRLEPVPTRDSVFEADLRPFEIATYLIEP